MSTSVSELLLQQHNLAMYSAAFEEAGWDDFWVSCTPKDTISEPDPEQLMDDVKR